MTKCVIIQLILTRLAPPDRQNNHVLSAPTGRPNRPILLSEERNPSGMKSPSAETASFARYRQAQIANSIPTANALSP
jgi:hypothetical protein